MDESAVPGHIARLALSVAQTQLGVHEQGGPNCGPQVKAYLASVGLSEGEPWCQAFVNWCLAQAASRLGVHWPQHDYPITGYTPDVAEWAAHEGLAIAAPTRQRDVRPGDQVLFYIESAGRIRHTGFVLASDPHSFSTYEGNTSPGPGVVAEGDGVYRKMHAWAAIDPRTIFVRLPF